jgi:hypothetical protein
VWTDFSHKSTNASSFCDFLAEKESSNKIANKTLVKLTTGLNELQIVFDVLDIHNNNNNNTAAATTASSASDELQIDSVRRTFWWQTVKPEYWTKKIVISIFGYTKTVQIKTSLKINLKLNCDLLATHVYYEMCYKNKCFIPI